MLRTQYMEEDILLSSFLSTISSSCDILGRKLFFSGNQQLSFCESTRVHKQTHMVFLSSPP